jgi:hypothetical protein
MSRNRHFRQFLYACKTSSRKKAFPVTAMVSGDYARLPGESQIAKKIVQGVDLAKATCAVSWL